MKLTPEDKLFSEFIRKRAIQRVNGCERCLSPKTDYKELQCSHLWGRSRKYVRWDEDNCVGLCGGCHMYFTSQPHEHTEWFKQHLGELNYDLLTVRAYMTHPKPDKEAIKLYYKEKIKSLGE